MNKIFLPSSLEELREYLSKVPDGETLREQLYAEFLRYARYSNVTEWNAAVRICEALAIIGWGRHEPLEAIRTTWVNGNPETFFRNRYAKPRHLDAVWSKRKDGFAIDYSQSFFHCRADNPLAKPIRLDGPAGAPQDTPLHTQRNWIPKNPIRIMRGLANCYENSKPLIESIERKLIPELDRCMRPELYGTSVDTITLNLSFSFYDNYHCKTNYIIADETLKLKQKDFYPKLLEMYPKKEIDDNGYFLRNRFTYGPFRKETGTARVSIVLEKEFSQQPGESQKQVLSQYLIHALGQVANRLVRKIDYDFKLMLSDFVNILNAWVRNDH